jgi:hypothetical protein
MPVIFRDASQNLKKCRKTHKFLLWTGLVARVQTSVAAQTKKSDCSLTFFIFWAMQLGQPNVICE